MSDKIEDIKTKLKNSLPGFSERVDRMSLLAQEIADSKEPCYSLNMVVPTLDAVDAYVLGAIMAERMISHVDTFIYSQSWNGETKVRQITEIFLFFPKVRRETIYPEIK